MFKLVVFTALLAVAAAAPGIYGTFGAPLAAPIAPAWGHGVAPAWGHGVVSAPLIRPLPVATSYANTVKLAAPAVVAAPAYAHAPIVAAPAYAHAW